MSSEDIAISVKNLTKTYRLFDHPGDRIKQFFGLGLKQYYREFNALCDVTFDIRKGETIGIIGRNGAGKSTLLQLICGITKPTSGSIEVRGRISALLELGAGFNPEFSGKENVYFQGSLMGLSKEDIDKRFGDIAAFAEIGKFMDQAVRTYSSGMFVRLAFAAAIHLDPDILVIDEALAVGDLIFQRKCFDFIERMLSTKQRVVILVSHDLRQVERFCSRVIYLESGRSFAEGRAHEICQMYYEKTNQYLHLEHLTSGKSRANIASSGEIELLDISVVDVHGRREAEIESGEPLRIVVRLRVSTKLAQPEIIVGTQAADMQFLTSATTAELGADIDWDPGEHRIEYFLEQFPLSPGKYFVRLVVRDKNFRILFVGEGLCPFLVRADSLEFNRPPRLVDLKTAWMLGGVSFSPVTLPSVRNESDRQ